MAEDAGSGEESKPSESSGEEQSRDDNTISPEEFSKLESEEESKKGLVDRILHKKDKKEAEEPPEEKESLTSSKGKGDPVAEIQSKVDELTLKLEKLAGKMEAEKGSRDAISERLGTMQEELGELRSMILDREKTFNAIESGFQEMKDKMTEVDPGRIRKEFDKKEKMIIDVTASVEKVKNLAETMAMELKGYRSQMSRVKSIENLLDESKMIDEKLKKIRDAENYIDKTAAKVEKIFLEVKEKLPKIASNEARLEAMETLSRDIMSNINELTVNTSKIITRDDIKKEVTAINTALVKVAADMDDLKNTLASMSSQTIEKYRGEVMETLADVERKFAALDQKSKELDNLKSLKPELVSTVDQNTAKLGQMVTREELSKELARIQELSGVVDEIAGDVAEGFNKVNDRIKGVVDNGNTRFNKVSDSIDKSRKDVARIKTSLNEVTGSLGEIRTARPSCVVTKDYLAGELAKINQKLAGIDAKTARFSKLDESADKSRKMVSEDMAESMGMLAQKMVGVDSDVKGLALELMGLKKKLAAVSAAGQKPEKPAVKKALPTPNPVVEEARIRRAVAETANIVTRAEPLKPQEPVKAPETPPKVVEAPPVRSVPAPLKAEPRESKAPVEKSNAVSDALNKVRAVAEAAENIQATVTPETMTAPEKTSEEVKESLRKVRELADSINAAA